MSGVGRRIFGVGRRLNIMALYSSYISTRAVRSAPPPSNLSRLPSMVPYRLGPVDLHIGRPGPKQVRAQHRQQREADLGVCVKHGVVGGR